MSQIEELVDFVDRHGDDDCAELLLRRDRYPGIDIPMAVQQIEGRREAAVKWPSLAAFRNYLFPPRLNREQSSSEQTAHLKSRLVQRVLSTATPHIADLTGGMGIDTLMLAQITGSKVDYVEQDGHLCQLMRHNTNVTGNGNISIHHADSMQWLSTSDIMYDLIFIDPARRDSHGRKVAAFEQCTPDIIKHAKLLRDHCRRLMVKASPMADISLAVKQLGDVDEVHVVALHGECKELLLLCGGGGDEPRIFCHNIKEGKETTPFTFLQSEETKLPIKVSPPLSYLYEPDATLMKAAPFKTISQRWDVGQLAKHTHLYTGHEPIKDFPGRQFKILQTLKLNRKSIADAIAGGKAHVVTRNFPMSASELQRHLGLAEGGEMFVVATRGSDGRAIGLLCERIDTSY